MPRMVPVFLFAAVNDCPAIGAISMSPLRTISSNMRACLDSVSEHRLREVCVLCIINSLTGGQGKVDDDARVHFDRFSVYEVRLVTPLLYRIDSSLNQYWQTAFNAHVLHGAICANDGHQHYDAFNPSSTSLWRILGRDVVDEVRFSYPGGDTHSLHGRLGRFREDGRARGVVQHFVEHTHAKPSDRSTRDTSYHSARCGHRRR